jgi:hypothetical protein
MVPLAKSRRNPTLADDRGLSRRSDFAEAPDSFDQRASESAGLGVGRSAHVQRVPELALRQPAREANEPLDVAAGDVARGVGRSLSRVAELDQLAIEAGYELRSFRQVRTEKYPRYRREFQGRSRAKSANDSSPAHRSWRALSPDLERSSRVECEGATAGVREEARTLAAWTVVPRPTDRDVHLEW